MGGVAGALELIGLKRNCSYARVAAAAVALADFGQVHHVLRMGPGIGAHGNLGAEAALAETDAVDALGMQIVRDELVIAFQIVIGEIEEDGAVFALGALAENLDGFLMAFHQ